MQRSEQHGGFVLVVDDDPLIRQAVQWALEDEGLSTQTAGSGHKALECAARGRPSLVILDYGLPEDDGATLAAQLRSVCGESLPIVLITADGRAQQKAVRVGALAYLHKPFQMEDLIRLVHAHLAPA